MVADKTQLINQYEINKPNFQNFLLINCGANFDILETLNAEHESIFYICDNHRPINLNNFYNQRQIKILSFEEEFSNIPAFEDVFREDSDSESEDESLTTEHRLEKRIARKEWEKQKQEIVIDYEAFSYFSVSSAVVFYDICYKLSLDDITLLWFAIVAHTSSLVFGLISQDGYIDHVDYLQNHMTRLSNAFLQQQQNNDENKTRILITFEEELSLWLYRHWNLRSVLETTILTAAKFRLFTEKGSKRLDEFLAHMGLSRRVCEQRYSTMKSDVRKELHSLFTQYIQKFGISKQEIFFPSFNLKTGYKSQFNAMDSALLLLHILEFSNQASPVENFHSACEFLTCWTKDTVTLDRAFLDTQFDLKTINQQTRAILNTDELIVFGPFLYVHVVKDSVLSKGLKNNLSSYLLARYILTAKASIRSKLGANKRTAQMPLILCLEKPSMNESDENDEDYLMLVGIPPLLGDDDRNLFGQAFEVAAKKTRCRAKFNYFDTNSE